MRKGFRIRNYQCVFRRRIHRMKTRTTVVSTHVCEKTWQWQGAHRVHPPMAGAIILGMEEERRNWDKIGANMNNIRTKTLLKDADIVVVRFGPKYRQWNAAFDAGYAAALGKSIITLHPPEISHMLKEVNASASAGELRRCLRV